METNWAKKPMTAAAIGPEHGLSVLKRCLDRHPPQKNGLICPNFRAQSLPSAAQIISAGNATISAVTIAKDRVKPLNMNASFLSCEDPT